jgi:predicted DCC family thiol-disulfide oxidoreductase YuxK
MRNGTTPQTILYFDGVCTLCSNTVAFIIKHDKKKRFHFATLQSLNGAASPLTATHDNAIPQGAILLHGGRYYYRSAAALHTLRLLGNWWALLFVFIIVPPPVRNFFYNIIARNRYKWFGRKATCMVPSPELEARFISV